MKTSEIFWEFNKRRHETNRMNTFTVHTTVVGAETAQQLLLHYMPATSNVLWKQSLCKSIFDLI